MNNLIAEANRLFKNGNYSLALEKYQYIQKKYPELGKYLNINIEKINKELTRRNKKDPACLPQRMRILLIGRTETYLKGGIHKSCKLISSYMKQMGHTVIEHDTSNPLGHNIKNIDICIIYTGDPERPDFETVDEKIKILQAAGIPILINLSYNLKKNRTTYIVNKILEYNKNSNTPVLAFFFTESAAQDPALSLIRDYTCVIPKTILLGDDLHLNKFKDRSGICIGDVSKFQNSEIFGGSPQLWIDAIKKMSPEIDIYAYKQYSSKNELKNITYVPYMKNGFCNFLSQRRLFIALTKHCTFEMVPCEAQFYGVPVIYRHMPQSLSELISITGIAVRTPEEAAYMVGWLYNDELAWNRLSAAAIHNAKSKSIDLVCATLVGYVKLALYRSHSIHNRRMIQ